MGNSSVRVAYLFSPDLTSWLADYRVAHLTKQTDSQTIGIFASIKLLSNNYDLRLRPWVSRRSNERGISAGEGLFRPPMAKATTSTQNKTQESALIITVSIIKFVTTLVERFGWPGTVLVLIVVFVEKNASIEQKHAIIDLYILGKGMSEWWTIVVPSVLFLMVLWAQWEMNKRSVKALKAELTRIADERSFLQERLSGRDLQHGE